VATTPHSKSRLAATLRIARDPSKTEETPPKATRHGLALRARCPTLSTVRTARRMGECRPGRPFSWAVLHLSRAFAGVGRGTVVSSKCDAVEMSLTSVGRTAAVSEGTVRIVPPHADRVYILSAGSDPNKEFATGRCVRRQVRGSGDVAHPLGLVSRRAHSMPSAPHRAAGWSHHRGHWDPHRLAPDCDAMHRFRSERSGLRGCRRPGGKASRTPPVRCLTATSLEWQRASPGRRSWRPSACRAPRTTSPVTPAFSCR
jgi:hypothetical protein